MNADRIIQRSILMRGPEDYITLSKDFPWYEITSAGVTVRFGDGSEVEDSSLVGADGARSRVRKQSC